MSFLQLKNNIEENILTIYGLQWPMKYILTIVFYLFFYHWTGMLPTLSTFRCIVNNLNKPVCGMCKSIITTHKVIQLLLFKPTKVNAFKNALNFFLGDALKQCVPPPVRVVQSVGCSSYLSCERNPTERCLGRPESIWLTKDLYSLRQVVMY